MTSQVVGVSIHLTNPNILFHEKYSPSPFLAGWTGLDCLFPLSITEPIYFFRNKIFRITIFWFLSYFVYFFQVFSGLSLASTLPQFNENEIFGEIFSPFTQDDHCLISPFRRLVLHLEIVYSSLSYFSSLEHDHLRDIDYKI